MNKKIKDLTKKEFDNICEKYASSFNSCTSKCPLFNAEYGICCKDDFKYEITRAKDELKELIASYQTWKNIEIKVAEDK